MKKFLAAVIAMIMVFSLVTIPVSADGIVGGKKPAIENTGSGAYINAYNAYSGGGYWVGFNEESPDKWEINGEPTEEIVWAAAYAGGKVYGFTTYATDLYDNLFFVMDAETRKISHTAVHDTAHMFLDMAYNHVTGEMYALAQNNSTGVIGIYTVDLGMNLGALTLVSKIEIYETLMFTFAIDGEGKAYGIRSNKEKTNSYLCSIDLATGDWRDIGPTGIPMYNMQTMTWDHNTDRLFWAHFAQEGNTYISNLYTLNTDTGAATLCGPIDDGHREIVAMWIANNEPTAPVQVPDYTVTFVDGFTNETISTMTVPGGTALDTASFPAAPDHTEDDAEFANWEYEDVPVYADITVTAKYNVLNAVYLNGFVTRVRSGSANYKCGFSEQDPSVVDNYGGSAAIWAAAYYNGVVYGFHNYEGFGSDHRFFQMDPETRALTYPEGGADSGNMLVYAMAYNYADETMYALTQYKTDNSVRMLYTVDLALGTLTHVADISSGEAPIATFAIDGNGSAYGLTAGNDAGLYNINLANGECTLIAQTGVKLQKEQSMTWDYNTNRLFWAQYYDYENNGLYIIDPNTAQVRYLGMIDGEHAAEVTALWIAGAPSEPEPETYTVTFDPNGGTLIEGETAPMQEPLAEGATFTLPGRVYTKQNYYFAGWKDDTDTTYQPGDPYTMPAHNVTLTPVWNKIVKTMNVRLDSEISLGFKLDIPKWMIDADPNMKMVFSYPDKEGEPRPDVEFTLAEAMHDEGTSFYHFYCPVVAKEMIDNIHGELVGGNGVVYANNILYSVRFYVNKRLNNPNESDNAKSMYKALLNYGAAMQLYKGYKTDNLANNLECMTSQDKEIPAYDFADYSGGVAEGQLPDGVVHAGSSLMFISKTTLRFKFTGDITGVTFKINGVTVEPVPDPDVTDKYYIESDGIFVVGLDKPVIVEVTKGSETSWKFTFGAFDYGRKAYLKSPEANLTKVMQGLYDYYLKAKNYQTSSNG